MDENNHLFCGHGEQMFTVILCSVGRKKKASLTQHKQPRCPGSVRTLAFGSYFIYHGFILQAFQVWGWAHQLPHLQETLAHRGLLCEGFILTVLGLGPSSLKPKSHLLDWFSCLFLWRLPPPPQLLLLPTAVAMLWAISVRDVQVCLLEGRVRFLLALCEGKGTSFLHSLRLQTFLSPCGFICLPDFCISPVPLFFWGWTGGVLAHTCPIIASVHSSSSMWPWSALWKSGACLWAGRKRNTTAEFCFSWETPPLEWGTLGGSSYFVSVAKVSRVLE